MGIGEVRYHEKRGLFYVFEFNPNTEKLNWLRLDTFIWGKWRDCPLKTAPASSLTSISNIQQKKATKALQSLPNPHKF